MNQDQIISAIETYLNNEKSDYAIMVSGAWGSGKTYCWRNTIKGLILDKGFRPIYISLIGVKSEDVLRQNIYEKINPFYRSSKKTEISYEAEMMERRINKDVSDIPNIPKNIVFCFDDLERIAPDFFGTAMGYLNTFIEHNNNKCIFLCNETVLKEISDFKTIKEKYIRYTYHLKADIDSILEELVKLKGFENLKGFDCSIISNMYRKGRCTNIRTLLFSLSILDAIFKEFNLGKISVSNIDIKYTKEIIARFVCFIAIELKKGTEKKLLDEISIAIVTKNPLDLFAEDFEIDLRDNDTVLADITEDEKGKIRDEIVKRYFSDNPNVYFQFLSISDYISNGLLNLEILKKEINNIDIKYNNQVLRNNRKEIVDITTNPYNYTNDEIIDKLNFVANEVEKGLFDLKACLQLYSNLLWLSSFNIRGYKVTDEVTLQFKKGVEKYLELNKPNYIPYLVEGKYWDEENEYAQKFREFKDYINSKNIELQTTFNDSVIVNFIDKIKCNDELVHTFLIAKSDAAYFSKENALEVFDALMYASPKTTQQIYSGFMSRYANEGSIYSQIPRIENEFIIELNRLVKESTDLETDKPHELSFIPVTLLGNYLDKIISEHHLIVENNEE